MADKLCVLVLTIEPPGGTRRGHAAQQLQRLGLTGTLFDGVDARRRKTDPEYSPRLNALLQKRALSDGEIACYMSHRAMWRRFLDSGAEFGLFFEDDFEAIDADALTTAVRDCTEHPAEWDVVKFFDYAPKNIVLEKQIGATRVVAYKYVAAGMVAYLINRKAAERFLSRRRIYRPVDEDIAHMWEFGVNVWSVSPNPVIEISDRLGGSYLADDRDQGRLRRNRLKSFLGMFIQMWRQVRSRLHRRRMRSRPV